MRIERTLLGILLAGVVALPAGAREIRVGHVTGTVTDSSGAVLPGVTVTAAAQKSEVSETVVTDGTGKYDVELPVGTYVVTFQLDGFDSAGRSVVELEPEAPKVVDRVLELAGLSETVTVVARAPVEPPPPPPEPPAPLPELLPVPAHDMASVCGPRQAQDNGEFVLGRISAQMHDTRRLVLGDRDILLLDAGETDGIEPGQNFVVRRRFDVNRLASARGKLSAEHTSALIQVAAVEPTTSLARVVYVCSEIAVGDYIEPFAPIPAWVPAVAGRPDFEQPARVLFADQGRTLAAPTEMMVIDRGSNAGARPGQRLTMFRKAGNRKPLAQLGEAIVVAVEAETATIRIETAFDAIEVGDAAALHR